MTRPAAKRLAAIKALFVKAGKPAFEGWIFAAGERDAAYDELASLELLTQVFGTKRGFAWQLTRGCRDSFLSSRERAKS